MRFLVTGTAGFIGFHVAKRLIEAGHDVVGIDGMTPYYDVALKRRRHAILLQSAHFSAQELMLEDAERFARLYRVSSRRRHSSRRPGRGALQPGKSGRLYQRQRRRHLQHPRSLRATTRRGTCCSLRPARSMAPTRRCRSRRATAPTIRSRSMPPPRRPRSRWRMPTPICGRIPTTVFRFFSVYGPWGRPDMALFKFTKAILAGEPIDVYNHGQMDRDFTYVDDIANAITLLVDAVPGAPTLRARDRRRPRAQSGGAIPRGQYRERRPGAAAGIHRGDRNEHRQEGDPELSADAARRCSRQLSPIQACCAA